MTRHLLTNIALGAASAFALTVAVPAFACDCDKKASTTSGQEGREEDTAAPATPKQAAPAPEKKAEISKAGTLLVAAADCKCGAKDPKDCKCEKGCKCQDKHGTTDKPKASADTSSQIMVAAACACGAKEAKDCKCGEKCKCTEKKDAPKAKAA